MPKASKSQLQAENPRKTKLVTKSAKKVQKPANGEGKKTFDVASPELLKRLVDNNEKVRAEAVLTVSRMVASKRQLELSDLQKLWRGLWFSMWHSDTPIVQQQLAKDLADLFSQTQAKNEVAFVEAFWFIMLREWETLDRYRINKFYMLVRCVLNAQFTRVKQNKWPETDIAQLASQMVSEEFGPLSYANKRSPHSLRLHLADIYLDELEKVIGEDSPPSPEVLKVVLSPVLSQPEFSEFKHIKQKVVEDVLSDERLAEWGLQAAKEEKEEEDDESDWEGFD